VKCLEDKSLKCCQGLQLTVNVNTHLSFLVGMLTLVLFCYPYWEVVINAVLYSVITHVISRIRVWV